MQEELSEDRRPGDGGGASAVAQHLLRVAIGDCVAERRGDIGIETAHRDNVPDTSISHCADHVSMVVKHIDCLTIARDENDHVGAIKSNTQRSEIRVIRKDGFHPRWHVRWSPARHRHHLVITTCRKQADDPPTNGSGRSGHRNSHGTPSIGRVHLDPVGSASGPINRIDSHDRAVPDLDATTKDHPQPDCDNLTLG